MWGFFSTCGGAEGTAVLGLPTSSPSVNPANVEFVYQRFQNRILPTDLAAEVAGSPLLRQYDPLHPQALARPAVLSQTDLADAFVPDVAATQEP